MKTSKLLITSLLAAAATMSVPAYGADDLTITSNTTIQDGAEYAVVSVKSGATVTQDSGTATFARLMIHTATDGNSESYLLNGGVLNITGGTKATASALREDDAGLIIGHWGNNKGLSTMSVSSGATLNVTNGWTFLSWDTSSQFTIGGEANLYGISFSKGANYTPTATLTLSNGGRLNLGAGGFANETVSRGTCNVNLGGGTLGALEDWSAAVAMNVTGAVEIDTTKRVASTSGTSSAATGDDAGATISLSGNIVVSESGSLTVSGSGTLDLSRATFTGNGAFELNGGNVVLGNVSLLGDTALLSASTITATSGTVELSGIIKNGTYTIFTGTNSASLTESGISLTGTVNSGYTQTWAKNGNDITVTISGAARDLIWSGAASTTWDTTSANWKTSAEATESTTFNTYDYVTFGTSGNVSVTVAAGGVTTGAVNITAGTVSFTGGAITAVGGVSVTGTSAENIATLKLTAADDFASGTVITVGEHGVFDINGKSETTGFSLVLDGGRLTNTGTNLSGGAKNLSQGLTLTADSYIGGAQDIYFIGANGTTNVNIDLGGYTLTKDGTGALAMCTGVITNGTLKVTAGTLESSTSSITNKTIALGTGGRIEVVESGVMNGTISSMGAGSSLTLAGTGASTVTLNGAVGENAVVSVSGNSAVTGTITDLGNGAQLTLAGTGASSVTWRHDGDNKRTNASIFIGAGSTFTDVSTYKYHLTLSGELSGAGTLVARVADNGTGQNDGWRKITLSGSTAGFTGEWQLESANGSNGNYPNDNRHVLGILNSSDGVFGGVVKFTSTNADSEKISSKLVLLKDMEIGGLEGTLANTSVVGASAVSLDDTAESITTANRALTINVADGKSYDYAGKIDSTISGITKKGAGTQTLSGDNSAYTGAVTLEAGTLVAASANALGTNTVTVTGDAKLALGEELRISNDVSIADSVKLTLGGGYVVGLNGAITGSGTLRADMLGQTVTLGGDNSGFSGAVEVVGTIVDAAHASALGTGILKISSANSTINGTPVPIPGNVQASTAGVVLHDVSIELVGKNSAALHTSSGNFTVASDATLYLDIGALGEDVLTGDEVALTITAGNAISDGRFFNEVLVGTYDPGNNWINDTKWAYEAGSWNADAGTLLLISVPEPSVFGLLAGLGALALAGTRRRRRKA